MPTIEKFAICNKCNRAFIAEISVPEDGGDATMQHGCPYCGAFDFKAKFEVNPKNWVGTWGSNG